MSSHPINLALRFVLELSALVAMGTWGWHRGSGWSRFVLAIAVPLIAAALWGVFAVPNDPSRGGTAVIPVPGLARMGLELAFFGFAVWALRAVGAASFSWGFGLVVIAHYAASLDRLQWLLAR